MTAPHAYIAPTKARHTSNQQLIQLPPHATHSPFTRHKINPPRFCCVEQTSGFSAEFPPPTWPGLLELTTSMSRPTQRWRSNNRQGSDDDGYDYAGSSSREWRTRKPWQPQYQSQPQQRDVPVTSSWQGTGTRQDSTERQQRSWHRGAVTTLRQSNARSLRQQQPLRSAEVSSPTPPVLPCRGKKAFAERQQKSPRSSWRTWKRDDRGSQSAQERFAQQRRACPTRARPDTQEPTTTGRARQEQIQIQRRPRDWDDTQLSPRPTRHIDEQLPIGKLPCRETNAAKQSRPSRQTGPRETSHDSESDEIDLQRDCHRELRSAAESVQEREPVEQINRRATSSRRDTFTSSTRLTLTHERVAVRPWAAKANARQRAEYSGRFASSSGSRNGVVVDATPDSGCDASSDYDDCDDLGDNGDVVVVDHIDDRDSRTRCRLVLGKRKAADGASPNGFARREISRVAASATAKVKQYAKVCMVGDCTSLVRSKGICNAHGGGKRCQYPEGCGKSAQGVTAFCIAHGGGKRCQYPEGCDRSAQGATSFCKAHGGGKRCQYPDGCNKSAIAETTFCVAHGGGKRCQYPEGCDRSAQGATSFCIAHGGGRRCQYPEGCDKGAEGRTLFCVAHGGGNRCHFPEGCDKSAQGATSFCKAHGGGKRCHYSGGCSTSAVGRTLLCKAHGGGKRCQYPDGCDKSAKGRTMRCIAHGGGKRCQYPDGCNKSAQSATSFCIAHGGGKRCQYPDGFDKGAKGRTLFCKAHGGGKRCQYPEGCGKSAAGRTLFCLAHGGGKRCQYPEGCDKSAIGQTMLCKAHGGGKRCQYPDGCDKSAEGRTMFCKAHGGGKRCTHSSGCNKHVVKRGMCKQHGVAAGLWA
jgi:hypothetical protein